MKSWNHAIRITLVLSAMLATTGAFAQERREVPEHRLFGTPESADHARAIEDLVIEFRSAWADQDADRLMVLHAHDVEWINAFPSFLCSGRSRVLGAVPMFGGKLTLARVFHGMLECLFGLDNVGFRGVG